MEVGKLKTASTPIFYFILDANSPDKPNSAQVSHYFVTTEVDSYVEAFYFVCRSLGSPLTEPIIKKWWTLYCKVFGQISLETFTKNLQTLPSQHFQLDTSEAAARGRLADHKTGEKTMDSKMSHSVVPPKESNLLVYPQRTANTDADVELHRIKAELFETQGHLRTEKSKQQVDALSNAERSALLYKLEQAKKDADSERALAKEASERLQMVTRSFEERLERLLMEQNIALRGRQEEENRAMEQVETQFLRREDEMRTEFEAAVKERDRKLQKAIGKYRNLETEFQEAAAQMELMKKDNDRVRNQLDTVMDERDGLEDTAKRHKASLQLLENQLQEAQRHAMELDDKYALKDRELQRVRAELDRYRRDSERFALFTSSLHTELRELDDNSSAANDLLKKRILRTLPAQTAGGGSYHHSSSSSTGGGFHKGDPNWGALPRTSSGANFR